MEGWLDIDGVGFFIEGHRDIGGGGGTGPFIGSGPLEPGGTGPFIWPPGYTGEFV